jgi:hypothetical protein
VAGIWWAKNGMNKFSDIYDLVKEDRISRGETFNAELNVFVERQQIVKSNSHRAITRKRKTIPRDDMGAIDTSRTTAVHDYSVPL